MKTKQDETPSNVIQLGMFPGCKISKGEDACRLVIKTKIEIKDTETGEVCTKVIPLECNKPDKVVDLITAAIGHKRTLQDIESFCKGRIG